MNCLIDTVVEDYRKKGKSLEAIRDFIKSRYRITIELNALRKRLELLNIQNSIEKFDKTTRYMDFAFLIRNKLEDF